MLTVLRLLCYQVNTIVRLFISEVIRTKHIVAREFFTRRMAIFAALLTQMKPGGILGM